VWKSVLAALSYVKANLSPADTAQVQSLGSALAATLKNASSAFGGYLFFSGTQSSFSALSQAEALPLSLDSVTSAFFQARVIAMQNAITAALTLQVTPGNVADALGRGKAAIPDPQYLEFLLNSTFETPPAGLTAANFTAQAQSAADTWSIIATALQTQGVPFTGVALNAVNQMGAAAQVTADAVANLTVSPFADLNVAWNTLIATPTMTRMAALVYNDPTSLVSQNTAVARYVILSTLTQVDKMLVALTAQPSGPVRLATVRRNDSPMDIANRELGNFELWSQIVSINGLVPPYISNAPAGPNVAVPGDQLLLPLPNGQPPTVRTSKFSYLNNFLGVDIYLGPINQDMLPWTGDFQLISGYQNLALSLGRRLQTALTTLIYHNNFGSRIPPEVGAIADAAVAGVLEAYTESALLADPRVSRIVSIEVRLLTGSGFDIKSQVLPNGLNNTSVAVNEVFGTA
jgi:hypothetical protein